MFNFETRKPRYLCATTMSAEDDGIDVGAGFGEAAERMSGDDNRLPEEKTPPAAPEAKADPAPEDNVAEAPEGEASDDDSGEDDGEKADKNTAKYIRELRKERREDRRRILDLEARLSQNSNPPLTPEKFGDIPSATREAPDPTDTVKYPLGVLDDRYIEDKIDWSAEQKVAGALNGQRQTEMARAAQEAEVARLADLRSKVENLTDKGVELFPDYEETVVETGLAGKWDLTETTFTAASESDHGAEILYNLSRDPAEASRVAKLSPVQQIKYVLAEESKIAEKRQSRRTPQAGNPPSNLPRGRNSSNPIRPDTDNLDDFRKLFYAKK